MRNILEWQEELPILQYDEYTQDEISGLKWNRSLTMCNKPSLRIVVGMARFELGTIRWEPDINHFLEKSYLREP